MSVTHRKGGGISAEGLEALRASILQEVEVKNAETEESIIQNIRENLVSIPVAGEEWNERKSYIAGDVVTLEGVSYTATHYSRGKSPALYPDKWTLTPTEEEIEAWDDIEDGTIIEEGKTVTYDGKTWVCTSQHFKSTVYRPKALSTKWEEVA